MDAAVALLLVCGGLLTLPFPLYVLWAWWRGPCIVAGDRSIDTPGVSLIIVVHDAADLITAKLNNCLALDYPSTQLEIIVYADGCTDATVQQVQAWQDDRVRLIVEPRHQGKIAGMNRAATEARHAIMVFSDVDAELETDALRRLLAPLADNAIGGVCGQRMIRRRQGDGMDMSDAQRSYVGLDSRIKAAENRLFGITSNDGKLYAVRRACYHTIPDAVTDDLYAALQVVARGRRFVFQPTAVAWIPAPSRDPAHELERRRRIVSTSLRGLWLMRPLFNPLQHGGYSLALFINKVIRRLLPIGLVLLATATLLILPDAVPPLALLGMAIALHDCLPGKRLRALAGRFHYAALGLLGTLLGTLDLLRGRSPRCWQPNKAPSGTRPRIAYTMSRFPKVTETFVLYEILALQRRGFEVEIFPLLLEHENTTHPEVAGLMAQVHFRPFLDLGIVHANLCLLLQRPRTYLSAWYRALHGAWPNRNFLLGALGVLPKAAAYAREMQAMRISHLHAHFATHATVAARFIHHLTGIPYSFTAHGHDVHISLQGFAPKARDAAFWVTISRYNLDLLAAAFGADINRNAHLVHCGVDLQRLAPCAPPPPGPLRILCVASFKEVKGHTYLIEACRLLHQRNIAFLCELIGDGPLRGDVEAQIATAGLTHHFRLLGQQPQPRVLERMCDSDLIVLTSILASRGDREGIPVCLMEAMALQRAVVASDLSGIPELVSDGVEGLLVPPRDSAALADAIGALAADPQRRERMGQAGRSKIAAEFDLAANAAQLGALLRDTAGTGQHP